MVSKSYFLYLLIYLSLIIFSYEQQCIIGQNCPYNQGVCVSNACKCYEGYDTLIDESLPADQQIFCNYKKFSQYTPIILEIFMPSIGHFVVGKYWIGLIKLSLLFTFFGTSYYLYQRVTFPSLFNILFEKIGISAFIDLEKGDEENGKNEEEENNGNEEEEENNPNTRLRSKKKDREKPNFKVKKQFHEEGDEVPDNQKPLLPKEENENNKEDKEKYFKILLEISGTFLTLLYFLDLFLYKLGVYKDGNGIPFA